jgi:hypothetical protein
VLALLALLAGPGSALAELPAPAQPPVPPPAHVVSPAPRPAPRVLSKNAHLKFLTISRGRLAPAFGPRRHNYSATVGRSVTHILITAQSADPAAQLSITNLNLGFAKGKLTTMAPLLGKETTFLLRVVAENGKSSITYRIRVTRKR